METPLEKLYTEYARALHRFAVGLTGNVDEASDIVQNVFMRLASKQNSSTTITKAYLFSAVRNGVKDFWKRKRPIPFSHMTAANDTENEMGGMDIPDDAPGPLEQAHTASEFTSVLKALQMLTEEQREVLSLKYFSGLSTREVAAEMGKNENTVRQMEFRALSSLRRVLQSKK
ncbi:sigma-70 family RNA polymerase sigma factor [Candidatus Parcubacteria bacterium]|nr:sigma-70 family RNA polymerase sigma factor [Candidatus Parcubacteria bacterium]